MMLCYQNNTNFTCGNFTLWCCRLGVGNGMHIEERNPVNASNLAKAVPLSLSDIWCCYAPAVYAQAILVARHISFVTWVLQLEHDGTRSVLETISAAILKLRDSKSLSTDSSL